MPSDFAALFSLHTKFYSTIVKIMSPIGVLTNSIYKSKKCECGIARKTSYISIYYKIITEALSNASVLLFWHKLCFIKNRYYLLKFLISFLHRGYDGSREGFNNR